jgi:hypothetical protein
VGVRWHGERYKAALRREVEKRNAVCSKAVTARAARINSVEGAVVPARQIKWRRLGAWMGSAVLHRRAAVVRRRAIKEMTGHIRMVWRRPWHGAPCG